MTQFCVDEHMHKNEWKSKFGDNCTEPVTHLFNTNAEVLKENHKELKKLEKPIVLVQAEHTGGGKRFNDVNNF